MRRLVAMTSGALLLITLTACGSGSGSTKNSTGSGAVVVEAYDNYFQPAQLQARPGQKLVIQFKNDGNTLHNFSINELGVSRDADIKKTTTVTITPTSPGTLTFVCKYHEALGMKGTLTVAG
jgi:plastocyanin